MVLFPDETNKHRSHCYSKKKNKVKFKVIKELERKYFNLQKLEILHPGNYIDQILYVKTQLQEFHDFNFNGAKVRSKANTLDFSEKPSRFFFKLENSRANAKIIKKIDVGSSSVTNNAEIIGAFQKNYDNLYTEEDIDINLANDFLTDVPKLTQDDSILCEGKIDKEEILKALKQMDNFKSPGSDGLPKDFYLTFFDIISDVLVSVYNNVYEEGSLSDTQKLSYITLICKDINNASNMKNYRPISLCNVDYKIISKVLTNRLSNVMDTIVFKDQTCCIKGRSIFDNIHLLRNVQDYVEQKKIKMCFYIFGSGEGF